MGVRGSFWEPPSAESEDWFLFKIHETWEVEEMKNLERFLKGGWVLEVRHTIAFTDAPKFVVEIWFRHEQHGARGKRLEDALSELNRYLNDKRE